MRVMGQWYQIGKVGKETGLTSWEKGETWFTDGVCNQHGTGAKILFIVDCMEKLTQLSEKNLVTTVWTTGNSGIEQNETVDRLTRKTRPVGMQSFLPLFIRLVIHLSHFAFCRYFARVFPKHTTEHLLCTFRFSFKFHISLILRKNKKVCKIHSTYKFFVKFYQILKIFFQNNIKILENFWRILTKI